MRVPTKNIGMFAKDLLDKCTASRQKRQENGAMFKNIFLTGDETGRNPAIFNNTFSFIDNLSSYLYSPVELRFNIDYYGSTSKLNRSIYRAASSELHKAIRRANIDTKIETGVTWSLVKGKCFIKLLWTNDGLEALVVQPEAMGVYQENLDSLDEQEAFVHTTYITPDRLWQLLATNDRRDELFLRATQHAINATNSYEVQGDNNFRQIVVGGFQPYTTSDQPPTGGRGFVQWLEAPTPTFSPEVLAELIPLHELWVWDDERGKNGEWTTIQFVDENLVLTGELTHRNIFADQYDPANKKKKTDPIEGNPLAGRHPFIEICANSLDGYFWGRSEISNTALLQKAINDRIEGIQTLLRRQENPPKMFTGTNGIKAQAYSTMMKRGGYLSDSNPNAKVVDLAPALPDGLWESLHEYEKMFDKMAGFTPTMSGRGESGVRSQSQAESLIRTASPRFKDRALLIERQVEAVGSLALDLLKAHVPDVITGWVSKKDAGILANMPPDDPYNLPPAEGMVPVQFSFHDLDDNCKVVVDSHSSSPAFSYETQDLMFKLLHVGAIDQEQLLLHTHPPGFDAMIENLQHQKAEKERLIQEHPELLAEKSKKHK